jgi:hypothetical protein
MREYSYGIEKQTLTSSADFFAKLTQYATITSRNEAQSYAVRAPDNPMASVAMSRIAGLRRVDLHGACIHKQAGSVDGLRIVFIDDCERVICCDFRRQPMKVAKP